MDAAIVLEALPSPPLGRNRDAFLSKAKLGIGGAPRELLIKNGGSYQERLVGIVFLFLFLKKNYLFINLFLATLGPRCCTRAFSSCGERGATLPCSAQASHCGGFSCCGARALGAWASAVVAHGL